MKVRGKHKEKEGRGEEGEGGRAAGREGGGSGRVWWFSAVSAIKNHLALLRRSCSEALSLSMENYDVSPWDCRYDQIFKGDGGSRDILLALILSLCLSVCRGRGDAVDFSVWIWLFSTLPFQPSPLLFFSLTNMKGGKPPFIFAQSKFSDTVALFFQWVLYKKERDGRKGVLGEVILQVLSHTKGGWSGVNLQEVSSQCGAASFFISIYVSPSLSFFLVLLCCNLSRWENGTSIKAF